MTITHPLRVLLYGHSFLLLSILFFLKDSHSEVGFAALTLGVICTLADALMGIVSCIAEWLVSRRVPKKPTDNK